MKKMYILTYDHGGQILWGDRIEERLHKVEAWLEKYPKFKTGLDYEAFTFDELEKNNPELLQYIKQLISKYRDRFSLGSTTYGQPLSMFITEEFNVRQLTQAIKSNKKHFGFTPPVYAVSEFAFHNQMPQLLTKCGYKSVLFRTHVMNYGYQKSFDSAYGIWQGSDGTEIAAIPTYKDAGEGYTNCTIDNWILTRWPGESQYSPMDFEKMYEKYEPLLASRYDDISNGKEELVSLVQNKANYEFVLLEELPKIYGSETPERLDIGVNDFHGRMPWGYCGNEIFNAVRKAEIKYLLAERVSAIALPDSNETENKLETALQYALASQHHDVTICGLLDEARAYTGKSIKASEQIICKSLNALSEKYGFENSDSLVCFNPNSFSVSQWISDDASALKLNGDSLPSDEINGEKCHYVTLPPFSVIVLEKSDLGDEKSGKIFMDGDTVHTPYYEIALSEKGIKTITLFGNRIIDNGDGLLFAGAIDDVDEYSNGKWQVTINRHTARLEYIGTVGSIECTFTILLNEFSPLLDCRAEFNIHGEKIGRTGITKGIHTDYVVNGSVHENKLRLIMKLCLDKNRKMYRDLPFEIAEWENILPKPENFWYEGSKVLVDTKVSQDECFENPCYLQGVYWLALRDENNGVAVMNRGCMGSTVLGNTLSVPLIYANDYMCGTRMLNGKFANELGLMFFDSSTSNIDIHKTALQYNFSPLAVNSKADKNKTIGKISGSELILETTLDSSDDVILTAFYRNDGKNYARYCNYSDKTAKLVFKPKDGCQMAETDNFGNVLCDISGNVVEFMPREIKTMRDSMRNS